MCSGGRLGFSGEVSVSEWPTQADSASGSISPQVVVGGLASHAWPFRSSEVVTNQTALLTKDCVAWQGPAVKTSLLEFKKTET